MTNRPRRIPSFATNSILYVHGSPLTGSNRLTLKKAASAATGSKTSGVSQDASAIKRRASVLETNPAQSSREYCGTHAPIESNARMLSTQRAQVVEWIASWTLMIAPSIRAAFFRFHFQLLQHHNT